MLSQDPQAQLLAEQLGRTMDRMKAELTLVRTSQENADKLTEVRLTTLERQAADYETRLRTLQDSATQFKLLASLATGGGLLSLIALIKALLGS